MKPRGLMTQLGVSIGAVFAFQDKQLTAVGPICSKALLKAEEGSDDAPGPPERRLGAADLKGGSGRYDRNESHCAVPRKACS